MSAWVTKTIDEVCEFRGGGTPSKANANYWTGDIPWVSPKDMKSDVVTESIDHISAQAVEESTTNLIPAGAVLVVVRSGILARTVPIAITGREVAINQDIKALCPRAVIDSKYLFYFLRSRLYEMLALASRGATVHRIMADQIRRIHIAVPPMTEQRRIVAILDEAFAAIATAKANTEKNLANARAVFQSHQHAVFAPKGNGWAVRSIAELVEGGVLAKPQDGNHGESHPVRADYVAHGVPFIMAADLQNGNVNTRDCRFITKKQAAGLRVGFSKRGDVLLSHKGTIGRVAILDTQEEYVVLTPQVTYYRVLDAKTLEAIPEPV